MNENEKQAYKDKILTRLFKSKIVHEKVEGIVARNISLLTQIQDDVLQETFYHLAKYPTDKFIEIMNRNPDKLIGLAVRIAILKGVSKNSVIHDYPKHSVLTDILFASNLKGFSNCNESKEDENDEENIWPDLPDNEREFENEIMSLIKSSIPVEDFDFIMNYNSVKKTGRRKKVDIERYNTIIEKIKTTLRNE